MALPHATTTVTILRPSVPGGDIDGYPDQERAFAPVLRGVRAVVAPRSRTRGGATDREGSEQLVGQFRLVADPCDLQHTDHVLDETTATEYRVEWVAARVGFGLDHTTAGLSFVAGYNP